MKKLVFFLLFLVISCADDHPFLPGFIKRAYDAVLTTCDPYNKGENHTCMVISAADQGHLYIYDASSKEIVLGPNGYRPLMVKVGKTTDVLVKVVGAENFPWLLALDRSKPALYSVRMLSADKKDKTFRSKLPQDLSNKPLDMAASVLDDEIIGVITTASGIDVLALDKNTTQIKSKKTFNFGTKLSRVSIVGDVVAVTDEAENQVHELSLKDLKSFLSTDTPPAVKNIDVGMANEKIYLVNKDLGQGAKTYGLIKEALGQNISLVNFDDSKVDATITPTEYPVAVYFPDQSLSFKGVKDWFSVVSVKGSLKHYSIKLEAGSFEIKEFDSIDMLSDDNLDLSTIQMTKIVGGSILSDGKKHEKTCQNNRQVFYIATGNSKSYLYSDSYEVEALGFACEDESVITRIGSEQADSINRGKATRAYPET